MNYNKDLTVKVQFRLDTETYFKLSQYCTEHDVTMSQVIRECCRNLFRSNINTVKGDFIYYED